MPIILLVSDTVKDSEDLRLLKRMLRYSSERNKNYFIALCKKKFRSKLDLNRFLCKFPCSSFVLDKETEEIEYSVFLSCIIQARELLWPKNPNLVQVPIFGKPDWNKASLVFQDFLGHKFNVRGPYLVRC